MRKPPPLLLLLASSLPLLAWWACSKADEPLEPSFAVGSCSVTWTFQGAKGLVVAPNSRNNFAGWFLKSNAASNSISLGPYTATKSGTVSRATVDDAGPLPSSLAPGQQVAVGALFDVGASGFGGVGLTIGSAGCPTIVPVSHTVTLSPTAPTGIPFGLFGNKPSDIASGAIWTGGSLTNKNLSSVVTQLGQAQTHTPKLRMWYNITGGNEQVFANGDGSFNLNRWRDTLDSVAAPLKADGTSIYYDSLAPYISDGTLQGINMLDDLGNFTPAITSSQLESMAVRAKLRFPTLLTAVRDRATNLRNRLPAGATYHSLDVAWAQFKLGVGTARAYRDSEIGAAQTAKLGLVLGINITDGGSVPLGTPVSPDSLQSWGDTLLQPIKSDYACGFMMWNNTYPFLTTTAVNALSNVANVAKNHVAAPCRRRP
jgi:hypothetical protein